MQTDMRKEWVRDVDEIIHSLAKLLNKYYVFPEVAQETGDFLELQLSKKEYEAIKDPESFCTAVTNDLQKISNDKHLRLRYKPIANISDQKISENERMEQQRLEARIDNYGFHKVERLPGNIGYIDLRLFHHTGIAGEAAVHAMNLITNTDALIFDMRKNGGGSPSMVALIISYLFDAQPVHLNSFYFRENDFIGQSWTLPYVSGRRYEDKPVYVLTSGETFSGAEEFTYNLKNLKRATVVGEVTGGGANPGAEHYLPHDFSVFIPGGRAINPITQTNWEGTGVTPDIETAQEKAFETAYTDALQYVINQYSSKTAYQFLVKEAETALEKMR